MRELVRERDKAIQLRKQGLSYNEILKQVPVAKSSLSLWLKDLPLTRSEKIYLKSRTNANISRGRIKAAAELRKRRLEREKIYLKDVKTIFDRYQHDPVFHAGIVMYWAEGAKTSSRWMIINTDIDVIVLMRIWLKRHLKVADKDILFRLFIHRPYADGSCEKWWQQRLAVTTDRFLKTIYKPTPHLSKQKLGHHGCLRIEVRNSKKLLFMMKIFKQLAVEYYQKE